MLTSFAPEPGRSLHSRLSSGTFPPSGFALPSPRSAVISAEVGRSFRRFPHHFPVLRETLAPLVSHTLHPPLTPAHPATLRSAPSHAPLTPRGASPTLVTHSIFSLGSRRFAHTGLRAASPGTDPREARCLSAPFIRLVSPSSRLAHFVPSARHSPRYATLSRFISSSLGSSLRSGTRHEGTLLASVWSLTAPFPRYARHSLRPYVSDGPSTRPDPTLIPALFPRFTRPLVGPVASRAPCRAGPSSREPATAARLHLPRSARRVGGTCGGRNESVTRPFAALRRNRAGRALVTHALPASLATLVRR